MKPDDLPVNDRVREAVRLVSKNMYDPNEPDWEKQYFANIRKNPLACIVKCLDRTNNLAGMADAFSRKYGGNRSLLSSAAGCVEKGA